MAFIDQITWLCSCCHHLAAAPEREHAAFSAGSHVRVEQVQVPVDQCIPLRGARVLMYAKTSAVKLAIIHWCLSSTIYHTALSRHYLDGQLCDGVDDLLGSCLRLAASR